MISTQLTVRVSDINYGGHLGHDCLITLLHQARLDYLQKLGASEVDCFGVSLIMRSISVTYLAEAFLGDVLRVDMQVSAMKATRFTLAYRVSCADKVIAEASTVMVGFDYQNRRVCALPPAFAVAVEENDG